MAMLGNEAVCATRSPSARAFRVQSSGIGRSARSTQQVQGLFVQCTIQPINKESDGGHGGHCHQQGHQQQVQLTSQQITPQQQEGQTQGRGTRGGW